VQGAFATGFAEFDSSWVLLDRSTLQEARGENGIDILEVKVDDGADSAAIGAEIETLLGPDWLVQRWETLNSQLFAALELQEILLFLVLGLIVVVSTFNTSSTLIILVRERLADIGVLGSLGLEPRQLWWIFVIYGMGLGALGTLLGVGLGAGTAFVITEFELVRFDPEVAAIYFIDSVPFRVEALDVLAIVLFSLGVTFLACSLPASRAARLKPAVAARDE
jgi:lipoprotein-releasing system permease protein